MLEVVPEEDDDGVEPRWQPRDPGVPAMREWPRRLRRRWAGRSAASRFLAVRAGAVLVAVACLAVVVQQGSVAARAAVLAKVPGLSVPLTAGLHEVWRDDQGFPMRWVKGGLILGAGEAGTSRVDLATGALRWSVAPDGWCTPLVEPAWGTWFYGGGTSLTAMDSGRLACVVYPDIQEASVLDDGRTSPGPRFEGRFVGLAPVGNDIGLAWIGADSLVQAQRWSPDLGSAVWTYRGTDPVIGESENLGVGTWSGSLGVYAGESVVTLDAATGREVGVEPVDAASTALILEPELPDGSTVTVDLNGSAPYPRTAADGTVLVPWPGWPAAPSTDDGSAAGLAFALIQDGTVAAVDLATGEARWSALGRAVGAVLDGRAVVLGSGVVSAIDVLTGTELWSAPTPGVDPGGTVVTDGYSVGFLSGTTDQDTAARSAVLTIVDLRTGVPRAQVLVDEGAPTDTDGGSGWMLMDALPDGTVLVMSHQGGVRAYRP